MKTATALLALLSLAAVFCVRVEGQNDHTYVCNQGTTLGIVATTVYYFWGSSDFINRIIGPGSYDSDVYEKYNCDQGATTGQTPQPVEIDVKVEGSSRDVEKVRVDCDRSIVAFDNTTNGGLNIYLSVYGDIYSIDGGLIVTILP